MARTSPWITSAAEDAASRAVVRYIRHTRLGAGGWTDWKDIASNIEGIEGVDCLEWLLQHSIGSHGHRLLAARPEGALHLNAAFTKGNLTTPGSAGHGQGTSEHE